MTRQDKLVLVLVVSFDLLLPKVVGPPAPIAACKPPGILGLLHHKHFMRVDEKRAVLFIIYSRMTGGLKGG